MAPIQIIKRWPFLRLSFILPLFQRKYFIYGNGTEMIKFSLDFVVSFIHYCLYCIWVRWSFLELHPFLGVVFINRSFKGRCRTRLPFGFDLGSVGLVVEPYRCCPSLRNEVVVHRSCPCGPWVHSCFRAGNQSPVLAWNLWEEIRQNL